MFSGPDTWEKFPFVSSGSKTGEPSLKQGRERDRGAKEKKQERQKRIKRGKKMVDRNKLFFTPFLTRNSFLIIIITRLSEASQVG